MIQIAILERKCDGCGMCLSACPFGAMEKAEGIAHINQACKACGLCVKACPRGAIVQLENRTYEVDKAKWQNILVFAETSKGQLHPVGLELIGKAHQLARNVNFKVHAVVVGHEVNHGAEELRHYGVDTVHVYEDEAFSFFRAEAFACCVGELIKQIKPSVVLVGATLIGRSLAPRLATHFHTGLTADCTALEMRGNTDLVQIRPAFGGNIMAQIVTANTRPQFATVRYRVMDAPERNHVASGRVLYHQTPKEAACSLIRHVKTQAAAKTANISDAKVLVVGGRGIKKETDLAMIQELAKLLGGEWAVTRPLVEKGWASNARQVGLSGRTVRPGLIITCGVSGAIQFTASMNSSEHIVAINTCEDAPIFSVAHTAVCGDLYQVLPELTALIKETKNERI